MSDAFATLQAVFLMAHSLVCFYFPDAIFSFFGSQVYLDELRSVLLIKITFL